MRRSREWPAAGRLIDLWFGPGPFRDSVRNWPDVMHAGLAALRRDATATADPAVIALLRRAVAAGVNPDPTRKAYAARSVVCPECDSTGTLWRLSRRC
jgi:hypothetical protein